MILNAKLIIMTFIFSSLPDCMSALILMMVMPLLLMIMNNVSSFLHLDYEDDSNANQM